MAEGCKKRKETRLQCGKSVFSKLSMESTNHTMTQTLPQMEEVLKIGAHISLQQDSK